MGDFIFGTVGSPTSTPPKPGGTVGAIQTISKLGLAALELGWVQAVRVSELTCENIRAEALSHNISLSVHAPYFINLNADETEWPKSRQRLWDAAHYGYLAGATDIVFHPGSYFSNPPQEVIPIAISRLDELVNSLRMANNPVILRPETMGKSALLGSFQDAVAISRSIPGVYPCLDFAHLHARTGNGAMNTFDEWSELLDTYVESLGKDALQHLHIHLSGIEYTAKGERNHLPLCESDLDLQSLFKALKQSGASGRILCESPILEEDALYMQELWKNI